MAACSDGSGGPIRAEGARSAGEIAGLGQITVVIADDHALFREALRRLLDERGGFTVIGEASNGADAIRLARELRPSVLLLDLHMPVMAGVQALQEISCLDPPVRTLIVAAEVSDTEALDVLQFGARGIVMKHASTELLFKSIRMVVAGQYWVGRECVGDLIDRVRTRGASSGAAAPRAFNLTARELDLVAAIADGCTNLDIASQLKISAKTVKHHLTNIFNKVGVSNRLELALFAVQHRIPESRLH
jgi:two-component system, NarL family, nitrate/nitrite response regulator NarL